MIDDISKQMNQPEKLYEKIRQILIAARQNSYQYVNFAMVQAYWEIGWLIVEHEQSGQERAEYGRSGWESLSERLIKEFGKGFDKSNLRKMRQF